MDADTTFKLLGEAYKQVTEKADTYGDDGHSIQAITILPSMPKPGKKGKVNEIALKEPDEKYVVMYHFGTIVKDRKVQGLLQAAGIDLMLERVPKVPIGFDAGLRICSNLSDKALENLAPYGPEAFTVNANTRGDGYMIFMKEQLLVHIFLQVVRHQLG